MMEAADSSASPHMGIPHSWASLKTRPTGIIKALTEGYQITCSHIPKYGLQSLLIRQMPFTQRTSFIKLYQWVCSLCHTYETLRSWEAYGRSNQLLRTVIQGIRGFI
jgi:hypothetical protein